MFAVGVAHRAEMRVEAGAEILQIAVVGKNPIASPEFTYEGVAVLKAHNALGRLADVGDDVFAFDRVSADQLCHRRLHRCLMIYKMS